MEKKVFIIAEAGVNHNGSISIAKKMVDAAKSAGADAVKFQSFNTEALISRYAPKAEYQKKNTNKKETQFKMLKKLELDEKAQRHLMQYCKKRGIVFLSSPFDLKSIDLLNRLGLRIYKVPSGELTNTAYLSKVGSLKKKVIISTGMANLKEVKEALDILISSGTIKDNITVLHCTTDYPVPMKDVNLRAMLALKEAFGVRVGYSDHTKGIKVAIAAAALGAEVIEKHFTLNKKMPGPDHKASLEPDELKELVEAIRDIEAALGNGVKKPTAAEERNKRIVRKSIVAGKDIARGSKITVSCLAIKRPGTGIEPKFFNQILGRIAKKDLKKDTVVKYGDLS